MHRFRLGTILAWGTFLVLSAPAYTQEHPAVQRGFSADTLYQLSDLDQVQLMNGGLGIRIPIGNRYPVGGSFSFGLTLTYSSKVWDFEEILNQNPDPFAPRYLVRSMPSQHANAGMSWLLSLGKLISPNDPSNETGRWQYLDPSGGRSSFFPTLHPTDTAVAGFSYSRDSRYLRMHELAGGKRTVEFPNGEIHTFLASGLFEKLEDRHGNFLTVSYDVPSEWVLTDSQGRTHTVYFKTLTSDGQNVQVVDRVELAAFGGTTATYTFVHESQLIDPACSDTFRSEGSQIAVPLLSRILLPDGSTFEFGYHLGTAAFCHDGLLASMTLPTLGRIDYNYSTWHLPTAGCDGAEPLTWAEMTNGISSRTLYDAAGTQLGVWQYDQSLLGPPDEPTGICTGTDLDPSEVSQTEVTTPDGDFSRHYFSVWPSALPMGGSPDGFQVEEYGLPFDRTRPDATGNRYLSSEIYDDGVLKRSIYVRYEYENPCIGNSRSSICDESNRRLVSQRTVYHDDSERYADVTYSDHDGLGHYRSTSTGGNFPSGNVRTTFTDFNPGHDLVLDANLVPQPGYVMWPTADPWVLETYAEQTVSEGGQTAKTQTCFDGDTGFLLRTRAMLGASSNQDDVLASFTPDGDGNVATEEYFGGDVQTVSTSSNLCGLSLPSSQYRRAHTYSSGSLATSRYTNADGSGVGFVSTNLTIDANTGLVAASQDPAGLVTSYEYDEMGRLLWEKPQAGHGAWTQHVYTRAMSATSPAKVQILPRANGSETGTILAQEEVRFDGFGRVGKERRLMPGRWVVRETQYDAMGRKSRVSEWADEDADPFVQHWTEYMEYDAFGRPGRIRPPDGAAHDVTMTYIGDRVVQRRVQVATSFAAESTALTVERYDRQGRLYQVVEASGDGNANVTTTYSYDVGSRLAGVSTPADGVTQVRSFNYDHLGHLQSESHPEKDGLVTYSGYDARGHPGRKIDGESDLKFTYDRAERVAEIREGSGLQRLLKSFEYSTNVAPNDWRKGKLWKATRYNYYRVDPPGPPGQIFADDFECGDLSAWSSAQGGGGGIGQPSCKTLSYDVAVKETYVYGGIGGRVSQRNTAITLNGNTGETFTQGWSYTELGDVASVDYPICDFNRCTSDGAGTSRMVSTTYTRGYLTGVTGYATITYHPTNLTHSITHSNGVVVTQEADPNGMARPASIEAKKGSTTLWSTGDYGFDGAGNVSGIGGADFAYDKVSRLTTGIISKDRFGSGSLVQRDYKYDAFGNLQNILGSPGRSTPSDSATNRLQGGAEYNAAGDLTLWNGNRYEYDAFHMMTHMVAGDENWLYVYTADDERIWQARLSATDPPFHRYTLRDLSAKVLREYTSTADFWVVAEDYVYRGGRLLAAETLAGRRHFHLDHLGTPRLITNLDGQQVAYHVYFPFGEEATNFLQDQERMKYTGHERDLANLGGTADDLDYMHARACSPLNGRFLSTDPSPASVVPTRPQTWNRFLYARSNPLKFIDPSGEIVIFANKASEAAYNKYKGGLDSKSQDYRNLVQLEGSNITYVVNVEDLGTTNEGSVDFDGNNVIINVDPGGPDEPMSFSSRMAHEIQHGVQVDNGELGFRYNGKEWADWFTDIYDEVNAWDAALRQANPFDLVRGPLAKYSRTKHKVEFLYRHGYGDYTKRGRRPISAPPIPGFTPGSVFRSSTWFYRIP